MSIAPAAPAGHDVLFAEDDAELVDVAGGRLAGALASGAAAIVIATAEHQRVLRQRIRSAGVDVDAAGRDGTLITLDAAETLDRLTSDGSFDHGAFDAVIGTVVRGAGERRPVEAFGEMVALLWDDDRPDEAIELEAAWDELVRQTSAGLLCAYPGRLVDDGRRSGELAAVCGLHSAVLTAGSFERSWRFGYDATAPSRARRLVANALRARGVTETTFYDTQSVVGELVANALSHAQSPFTVGVRVDGHRVLVRVGDDDAEAVLAPHSRTGPAGVRGLRLVTDLAERWGVEPVEGGKVVWAELGR